MTSFVFSKINPKNNTFLNNLKKDPVKIHGADSWCATQGGMLRAKGCLNHAEQQGMPQSPPLRSLQQQREQEDVKGGASWKPQALQRRPGLLSAITLITEPFIWMTKVKFIYAWYYHLTELVEMFFFSFKQAVNFV